MTSPHAFATYWMLRLMVKPRMAKQFANQTLEERRRGFEAMAARLGKVPPGIVVEGLRIGEIEAERVIPSGATPGWALLWFFGGGYTSGSPATERALAARIAIRIGAWALVPGYRLCPEHPLQASLDDAVAAYRWLSKELGSADRIVVGGASAGGGLALRLLCALRDAGDPLPAAALVISAATDLALTAPSLRTNAASDAVFPPGLLQQMRQDLTGISDFSDPSVSPLYADLNGLPPLLLHAAGAEALRDDSVRFAERARTAGVDVTLHVFPGLWHVFHAQAYVPEARGAVNEMAAFAADHLSRSGTGERPVQVS